MEAARLRRLKRVCSTARVKPGMPQRLSGIDVADSRDSRLVEKELFQPAFGGGEQFGEPSWPKLGRKCIDAQFSKCGTLVNRIPAMNAAELAAIREAENAFVQFERHVDVHAVFELIRTLEEFLRPAEPNQLTIEAEVERKQAALEVQEQVFPPALDSSNLLPFCETRESGGFLWPRRNGVKDVNAANPPAHHQRAQSPRNGFHLREFGHSS